MRLPAAVFVVCSVALGLLSGCRTNDAAKSDLPARAPTPPELAFTGPEQGYPPQPRDITNVREVPYRELTLLSEERSMQLRRLAEQDERVRQSLGERFAFIAADPMDPPKGEADAQAAEAVRLTFYSYSLNVAIEVLLRGERIAAVRRLPQDYQPPESREEIEAARRLALADERLRNTNAGGLSANGIISYPREGQPGYGHRLLLVTFSKENEDLPEYKALVDLTAGKVLWAGRGSNH